MDAKLEDFVVLITGAHGGIGRAVTTALAQEGARLVLHGGRNEAPIRAWLETTPFRDRACAVAGDLRERAVAFQAVEEGRRRFDRVDAVVINAGIWPATDEPLAHMDETRIRDVMEVNVLGALWTAQAFLRQLEEVGPRDDGRGASICFIGSTAGRFGEPGHVGYAASKAALAGVVRTLKNEIVQVDPRGRVNMVEPGWTVTPMAEEAMEDDRSVRNVGVTAPLQQLGRAEDIAAAVAFLTSPALARHVSGEIVTVAGGMEGRVLRSPDAVDLAAMRNR